MGVNSLADIATGRDRVCVLNILGGNPNRTPSATPSRRQRGVRHLAGRLGQVLATPVGDIPVFNNVLEGLDAGLAFNTGWSTCRLRACATASPS